MLKVVKLTAVSGQSNTEETDNPRSIGIVNLMYNYVLASTVSTSMYYLTTINLNFEIIRIFNSYLN